MNTDNLPFKWEPMQVRLIRPNGNDLDVVNAARRSFGQQSDWEWYDVPGGKNRRLNKADINLLNFLGRGFSTKDFTAFVERLAAAGWSVHEEMHMEDQEPDILEDKMRHLVSLLWKWRDEAIHDTPFNHVGGHFGVMIPIFVARQLVKTEYMPWSEISRRYKDEGFCYWKPGLSDGIFWREAPLGSVKQGSGGPLSEDLQHAMDMAVTANTADAHRRLLWMIESGVCLEQARMVLPANLMVEVTWSGFLGAICKMLRERTGDHAQVETQWVAKQMLELLRACFPVSVPALVR